jgi:hypothetical protein
MNNSQVAHAWVHGHSGKGSNLTTDGISLTSYSTTIAAHIDDIFYLSANNMSSSTGRHISYAHRAIGYGDNNNIFCTHAFSRFGSNPRLTHDAMIQPEAQDAIKTLEQALENTWTREQTKLNAIIEYDQRRETILKHAARVGMSVIMPEYAVDIKTAEQYQERKAAEAAEKEAARIKARQKQQREDKKQFNIWLTIGAGRCPYSFIERGNDIITLKPSSVGVAIGEPFKVITSQGAECPLDHAVKALRFYFSRTEDGKIFIPYHTNGHKVPLGLFTLDTISETGEVRAGCHTFTAKEIQRFTNQWRGVLGL